MQSDNQQEVDATHTVLAAVSPFILYEPQQVFSTNMSSEYDLLVAANSVQVLNFPLEKVTNRPWPNIFKKKVFFSVFQTFPKWTLWICSLLQEHTPELSVNAIMEPIFSLFDVRLKQHGLYVRASCFCMFLFFSLLLQYSWMWLFKHSDSGICVLDVLHQPRFLHGTNYWMSVWLFVMMSGPLQQPFCQDGGHGRNKV